MEIIIIVILIVFIALIPLLYIWQNDRRNAAIKEKINSIGGTVNTIERRNFFTGLGPFKVAGKGKSVYRVEYTINGKTKESWVRFGGLFGPDWKL